MSCARCGCGIYKTEEFISLNKVWHKYCFTCYQCSKRLDKETAKIFQGELFCENCYTDVIEKLFEVISKPSINKPYKVSSTPSCAINGCFEERLKNCENLLNSLDCCRNKEYCCHREKKLNEGIQRKIHSCSCIPSQNVTKDEYCFIFPIPREVANYYNRAHMKNKACIDLVSCTQPHSNICNCSRNPCCPQPQCQVHVRTLKNQCCCNVPPPRCRNLSPQRCCCFSSPKPTTGTAVFKKGCGCCLPQKPPCCESCSLPNRCVLTCRNSPPSQCCTCCPKKPQSSKSKCLPNPYCPPPKGPPPPPQCCVLPPRCPPLPPSPYWSPSSCCPQKLDECCCPRSDQSSTENSKSCCHRLYCQRTPKYCVCGNLNPCNCKMSQIKAQCTVCCIRCGQKVYAAEKILVSSGAFHTSCFTCYCCKKCLDVKNVFEGCGEIYCKQCYNHFFGVEYYGFGGKNC